MTLNDISHKLDHVSEKLANLERQKKERLRIMKYVNVDEEHLDRRDLILDQLDGKIRELDVARSRLIQKKGDQEKHFRQLKEGKTTELPENIRTYMEQNGIDLVSVSYTHLDVYKRQALISFMAVPFGLAAVNGISMNIPEILKNAIPLLLTFSISGICENLSFMPIIGSGALYMSCLLYTSRCV